MAQEIEKFIKQSQANQDQFKAEGQALQDRLRRRGEYYDPLEEEYRQRADTAYGYLEDTPGYTDAETQAILGRPDAAFDYYDPTALTDITERGVGDVTGTAANYGAGVREAADRTGAVLGRTAGDVGGSMRGAAGRYGGGVRRAAGELGEGVTGAARAAKADLLDPAATQEAQLGGVYNYLRGESEGALGDYGEALGAATDRENLGLSSDFASDYGLTDAEAQNFRDIAAQTTRGQYDKMGAEAEMRAAAAGNTSPAALAAIKQRLAVEGAAEAGDAATRAAMAANQERANRQRDLEGMRLSSERDIAGRLTENAGNLFEGRSGAASRLAGLEQAGISDVAGNRMSGAGRAAELGYASEALKGKAGLDAETAAGQADIDAERAAGNLAYGAAETGAAADYKAAEQGGSAAMDAARYGGTQRLGTATTNQRTGQELATAADTARSGRAQTTANRRIGGQQEYRGYVSGRQDAAMRAGANATGQAINAYGTQGQLQNTATGQGIQAATQKDNRPGMFDKILGAAGGILQGAAAAKKAFADGGVMTQPTEGVVGEAGPEKIVKTQRYGQSSGFQQQQRQKPRYGQPQGIVGRGYGQQQGYGQQPPRQRYGRPQQPMMSARGDGRNVPGNEPGGANGMYGRYSQVPGMEPTQDVRAAIGQQAQAGIQQGQPQRGMNMAGMQDAMSRAQQSGYAPGVTPIAGQEGNDYYTSGAYDRDKQAHEKMYGKQPTGGARYGNQTHEGAATGMMQGMQGQQPMPQATDYVAPVVNQPMPQASMQPAQVQSVSAVQPRTYASPFGNMNFGTQMADGGMAASHTSATVGEAGPEKVFKSARYRSMSNEPDSQVITQPTRVMLEPGEAVVPLDGHQSSKITPGMMQPRRYRMTGPRSTYHPMGPMTPAPLDRHMNNAPSSTWS